MKTVSATLALAVCVNVPDLANAQFLRASVSSSGAQGNRSSFGYGISSDGRFVSFESDATNLVPNDGNWRTDVFVHDMATGATIRVSVDSSGVEANNDSYGPSISGDGRFVAFDSYATNLVAGGTLTRDVFVHDLATNATELVGVDSSGVEGNARSRTPAISADGSVVAFTSGATNLVSGDGNQCDDIFIHDRITGATERVSIDSAGTEANGPSDYAAVSADGQVVAFLSDATNLVAGDTNGATDVFVHDRATGVTERVNVDSAGVQADNRSAFFLALSADGRVVAFDSAATNLVSGDTNGQGDVFVHDRQTGLTERVSVDSAGAESDDDSYLPSLSDDGQIVAFCSDATNLVSNDTNGASDAFVHDRATGITDCVSTSFLGVQGDSWSGSPRLSADGQTLAFSSNASNLVTGDTNQCSDVFVRFPCPTVASWSNYGAGFPGTLGVPPITSRSNPVLGSSVIIDVGNSSGLYSVALFFLGYQQADIPSAWGGHLLIQPAITELLGLPPSGAAVTAVVPMQPPLCGFVADLQALELDPGAAKGVSFTQGLELVLGR